MQVLDKESHDRFVARYLVGTAKAERKTRKLKGPLRETMAFPIEHEHQHICAAELTWYIQPCGMKAETRYGPNALRELSRTGQVTRTGHGVYRINRHHPELLAIQLELLEKSGRRAVGR